MNKKILGFSLVGIFAIMLVSAAIINYSVSRDVVVDPSFIVLGDNSGEVSNAGGEISLSDVMNVDSDTTSLIPLDIVTTHNPNEVGIVHTEEYILSASGDTGTDSTIYVDADDTVVSVLNDLNTISWDVNVLTGYIAHVDVLIDTTGDGLVDDALVFEYAKVDNTRCDETPYPTGGLNTFGELGTIDGSAYAWLTTGDAGPCSGSATFFWHSLDDWKSGQTNQNGKDVSGTTTIIGFDIEVDNWISDSDSDISNILINGNVVELSLKSEESLDFRIATEFGLLNSGTYTINTTVTTR